MLRSESATVAGSAAGSSSSSAPDRADGQRLERLTRGRRSRRDSTGAGGRRAVSPPITRPTTMVWSPPGIGGEPLALDVGQRAVEQDQALGAEVVADAVEPVLVLVGEAPRELLLGALQDVHHELGRGEDEIVQLGRVVHADRDQRRLRATPRPGCSRSCPPAARRASRTVRMVTPGGEAAEQLAEAGGIDRGLAQSSILARKSGLSTRRAGTKSPVTPISVSAMPGRRPSRLDGAIEQRGERACRSRSAARPPTCRRRPAAARAGTPRGRPAVTGPGPSSASTRGVGEQLGAPQRAVDPLAGERIEEVGRIAHQRRAVGDDPSGPGGERPGGEHLAHERGRAPTRAATPGNASSASRKNASIRPRASARPGGRDHQRDVGALRRRSG